ncbi:hypothetical protein F2Q68_00032123 [Brassica cretica]|uniref:Uncharacterized protein n=1 Tax=Brassica cretica TaxID=69181 RepID=A0A8S9G8H8_BRACR|nr:hypothetical protein F2Q68_00032123 [Brassica cretica]
MVTFLRNLKECSVPFRSLGYHSNPKSVHAGIHPYHQQWPPTGAPPPPSAVSSAPPPHPPPPPGLADRPPYDETSFLDLVSS